MEITMEAKRKRYKDIKNIRHRMKEFSLIAMGGCCQICKYTKCSAALEFHHLNPDEKEFSFKSIKGWDRLYNELVKCILLCALCHREVHYDIAQIPEQFAKFDKDKVDKLRAEHLGTAVKRPTVSLSNVTRNKPK